jgi:hypothetical protein
VKHLFGLRGIVPVTGTQADATDIEATDLTTSQGDGPVIEHQEPLAIAGGADWYFRPFIGGDTAAPDNNCEIQGWLLICSHSPFCPRSISILP